MVQFGGHNYMARSQTGDVVEVDDSGNLVQSIVSIPKAIAIVADPVPGPMYGHLLVSTNTNNSPSLYDVDPVARTATLITSLSQSGDGIARPGPNVLDVALNGYGVVGYSLSTGDKVWNSGQFTPEEGSPDGLAIGTGEFRLDLFVNTNEGTIVEVPINHPAAYSIIASQGTREATSPRWIPTMAPSCSPSRTGSSASFPSWRRFRWRAGRHDLRQPGRGQPDRPGIRRHDVRRQPGQGSSWPRARVGTPSAGRPRARGTRSRRTRTAA